MSGLRRVRRPVHEQDQDKYKDKDKYRDKYKYKYIQIQKPVHEQVVVSRKAEQVPKREKDMLNLQDQS